MGLASYFLQTRDLVLDTCAGAIASAMACLQLLEQRRFVRREKNTACFQDELPSLVEVVAEQVLISELDISKSEEAAEKPKEFVKKMAALRSDRSVDSWTMPPRLDLLHTILLHILCVFSWKCAQRCPF